MEENDLIARPCNSNKNAFTLESVQSKTTLIPRSQSLLELTPTSKGHRSRDIVEEDISTALAWKGYVAFVHNLSRKRASLVKINQEEKNNLIQKTHQLNVQIVSLKSLLKSADQVVMTWAKEMNELKRKLKQVETFNCQLTEETSLLAEKILHLTQSLETCKENAKNLKNSELQLQMENVNLELQLQMERDKVSTLRKENSTIEGKVKVLSEQFQEKVKHIDELGLSVNDLENLIDTQRDLIRKAEEQKNIDSRLLKNTGKELDQVNREVCCLTKLNKQLKEEANQLKKQLFDMELKHKTLEEFYHIEESSKRKWKNQIKQAATSFAQMSLYVLNVVAFPSSVASRQIS